MEDTHIIPGSFAYHIRIDVLDLSNSRMTQIKQSIIAVYKSKIEQFLTNFTNYYIFLEKGEKTKKIHLQGIIWSNQLYTNKYINKLKAKYFLWHRQCKNSLALTSAKKITSLASYVAKDKMLLFSNLSSKQREKIPTWQKKENPLKFRTELYKFIQNEKNKHSTLGITTKREIAIKIVEYYWAHNKRQPSRMDLQKILGHNGLYSAGRLVDSYHLWEEY